MQAIITDNHEKIVDLCRHHHVKFLAVFGSATRDDFDPAKSDIDLLVEFSPLPFPESSHNHQALREQFIRLFSRETDLIRADSTRNPYIRKTIEEDQETLYAA